MSIPRLTIGLPVRNGARYLSQSLDALLAQDYEDFELIISDNASTDNTPDICRNYERSDSRVRVIRQNHNVGLTTNHNLVFDLARGELFKWASHDDLYSPTLLRRCIEALDEAPDVILAHSWTAKIDADGRVVDSRPYPLTTNSAHPATRFRSLLFDKGGDDIYGVIRASVLRRVGPQQSHHNADRTVVANLALHGRFYQVPDWLYFRRDHAEQSEHVYFTMRSRCTNMDPRRASRLRNPAIRLYGEYIYAYMAAIHRAPLSAIDRGECYRCLAAWLLTRTVPRRASVDRNELVSGDVVAPLVASPPELLKSALNGSVVPSDIQALVELSVSGDLDDPVAEIGVGSSSDDA
jgi:glycosyltransferase involved in cell wall biosynthesis